MDSNKKNIMRNLKFYLITRDPKCQPKIAELRRRATLKAHPTKMLVPILIEFDSRPKNDIHRRPIVMQARFSNRHDATSEKPRDGAWNNESRSNAWGLRAATDYTQ